MKNIQFLITSSILHHIHYVIIPIGSFSKLCSLLNESICLWQRLQCFTVTNDLFDVLEPSNVQKDIKVGQQRLHDVPDAMFTHDAQTPNPESTDEDKLGSQCESLEDVRGAADSRVEHDVDFVADS